jgi:hypothetical protein
MFRVLRSISPNLTYLNSTSRFFGDLPVLNEKPAFLFTLTSILFRRGRGRELFEGRSVSPHPCHLGNYFIGDISPRHPGMPCSNLTGNKPTLPWDCFNKLAMGNSFLLPSSPPRGEDRDEGDTMTSPFRKGRSRGFFPPCHPRLQSGIQ